MSWCFRFLCTQDLLESTSRHAIRRHADPPRLSRISRGGDVTSGPHHRRPVVFRSAAAAASRDSQWSVDAQECDRGSAEFLQSVAGLLLAWSKSRISWDSRKVCVIHDFHCTKILLEFYIIFMLFTCYFQKLFIIKQVYKLGLRHSGHYLCAFKICIQLYFITNSDSKYKDRWIKHYKKLN